MSKDDEPTYPSIVKAYMKRYAQMADTHYLQEFRQYTAAVLNDPIDGADWKELLNWEHRHFSYTESELPKPRAEMPIDILKQTVGRCGEFALLYNGLLLANAYQCRIVLDCSTLQHMSKQTAGDHVWNEVLMDGNWLHVDPTEKRIDQPIMYEREWNKDVNLIYAITAREVLIVTQKYKA